MSFSSEDGSVSETLREVERALLLQGRRDREQEGRERASAVHRRTLCAAAMVGGIPPAPSVSRGRRPFT